MQFGASAVAGPMLRIPQQPLHNRNTITRNLFVRVPPSQSGAVHASDFCLGPTHPAPALVDLNLWYERSMFASFAFRDVIFSDHCGFWLKNFYYFLDYDSIEDILVCWLIVESGRIPNMQHIRMMTSVVNLHL